LRARERGIRRAFAVFYERSEIKYPKGVLKL